MDSETTVVLFVYGTLKKGFPAHEHFFGRHCGVAGEAVVRGELFGLPAGYPALAVPKGDILAVGTANPASDAESQRGTSLAHRERPGSRVHGEAYRLEDPERLLPALDVFEGFDPHGESLYRRVLIPAWTRLGETFSVWAYAMENPPGARISGGKWGFRGG